MSEDADDTDEHRALCDLVAATFEAADVYVDNGAVVAMVRACAQCMRLRPRCICGTEDWVDVDDLCRSAVVHIDRVDIKSLNETVFHHTMKL